MMIIHNLIKISRRYRTIYADPPWPLSGSGRFLRPDARGRPLSPNFQYSLMSISAIMALPVSSLAAPNAHLYLWTVNNFLPAGLRVMKAWGFRYITIITWAKEHIRIGQYFKGQTEQCLFGVRGRAPYRKNPTTGKQAYGSTLLMRPGLGHSVKPPEMYDIIQRVSYGPRLELFARVSRDGWDAWGNEL